jgi:hypothetical protein
MCLPRGTPTAWKLGSFLTYIRSHFSTANLIDITGDLRTKVFPDAGPGDMIIYDWGQGEGKSHIAFVVATPGGDPEVSEWSQYNLNPMSSTINKIYHIRGRYVHREWTWSKVKNEPLHTEFPNVRLGYFT